MPERRGGSARRPEITWTPPGPRRVTPAARSTYPSAWATARSCVTDRATQLVVTDAEQHADALRRRERQIEARNPHGDDPPERRAAARMSPRTRSRRTASTVP